MIEAISAIGGQLPASLVTSSATESPSQSFSNWVGSVDDKVQAGEAALRSLAVGEADSLHEVMLSLESARINFELLVQVRNRSLESIQELLRLQI